MSSPLVSILIPVYNVEAYLPQCLDSVIGQTYMNLQIVVIDDGSTDKSWEIMQEYAQKDNRIEIYHQDNVGVATTRNNLLEKIKGEYFLFIDSDDWMELDMVGFLLEKATNMCLDLVVSGNTVNDAQPNRTYTEAIWSREKTIMEFLKHVNFNGSLWNKLISIKTLYHRPKFNPEITYGEDALFIWQVIQGVNNALITDKQLYHHRMNENSISHAKWAPCKMGTGHWVWEYLEKETLEKYPKLIEIASTSFVISDMWQLYYAALSNYPMDENIDMYQKHLKNNLHLIRKTDTLTINKKIFAEVISRNYRLGSLIAHLSNN